MISPKFWSMGDWGGGRPPGLPIAISPTDQVYIVLCSVSLRWRLHFEFMTSKAPLPKLAPPGANTPDTGALWQGPANIDVETMVWDLPIKVFATNPVFVSSVSQLRTEASCLL